jgi:hypothetical protein
VPPAPRRLGVAALRTSTSQNRAQALDCYFCAADVDGEFRIDQICRTVEFWGILNDVQAPAGQIVFYAGERQVAKARSSKDVFQGDFTVADIEGRILEFRQFVEVLFAVTITPVYVEVVPLIAGSEPLFLPRDHHHPIVEEMLEYQTGQHLRHVRYREVQRALHDVVGQPL